MRKLFLLLAGFVPAFFAFAQVPDGYYDSADGLGFEELQQALHNIIDDHTVLSYDDLWSAFYDTDPRPDNPNIVWDMYSDNPYGAEPYTFTFGTDQCGNYSGEGSCYNREHSFPKSWYNDGYPMYTDLVQLVPTDGYVNGMRGNLA
ncbi:MAG: endonuclease, partial [Bacteroidales bacterium]